MNKTAKRIISVLLVTIMCFSVLAPTASAWTSLSHVNSADLILLELQRSAKQNDGNAKITVYAPYDNHSAANTYAYAIPLEYQDAIFSYPDAFRSGALGPDFYPDMVTGQMYTHPYFTNPVDQSKVESGEWITLLCQSVNSLPKNSEERKEALSFALGYMLHFCGDLFGHDFVNSFSGGTYPSYSDVNLLDATDAELNNIVSHMSVENYMDKFVNSEFYSKNGYLGIDGPLQFIADTMLFNGSANAGSASIFEKYGSVPYQYEYLIELRTSIYNKANEWRETMNPFLAMCVTFCDHWIEDIDRATYALVECFNNIAKRMVTGEKNPVIEEEKEKEEEENGGPSIMDEVIEECFGEISLGDSASTIGIIKEELGYWLNHYGSYATPIPDIFIDGIPYVDEILDFILKAIGVGFIFEGIEKLLKLIVKEIIVYALQEYIPELQEIAVALPGYAEKVMDPSRQLDSEYNPYKPSANNFAEFKVYMDKYAQEQELLSNTTATGIISGNDNGIFDKVVDSDFEAFYNTLVMFKLVIMDPQNFASFVNSTTGVQLKGFEEKLTHIKTTSLRLEIATADLYTAGTDDNVFAEVYYVDGGRRTRIMRKLLDKSNYNDFEAGDNDIYDVELPYPVRIDKLEVAIKQEDTDTAGEGWMCQNINITPMHAGVALIDTIGVGGNLYMKSGTKWYVDFQASLNERGIEDPRKQTVTNVKLKIKTSSEATYGGTDSDIYLVAYNGTTEWSKVSLDKPEYNDFEKGDNDEYNVSIEKYNKSTGLMEGIPLDKLALKIKHSGIDEWTIADMDVILCNGDLNLIAAKDSGLSNTALEDEEVLIGQLKNVNIPDSYFKKYSKPSLSYMTSVNDKHLFYINSIDAGEQWVDFENVLWSNPTIRKNGFFRIFKGFSPEIEYISQESIAPGEAFDMTVTFDGMWNGIHEYRRNAVADFAEMEDVNGFVTVSFINDAGKVVASTQQKAFTGSKATYSDFADDRLVPGCYDVKITYTSDVRRPMYSDAEKIVTDGLIVMPELSFSNQTPAMPEGQNVTSFNTAIGSNVTFVFDNKDVPEGFTVEKSGNLVGEGVNVKFSDGNTATLKYTFTKGGVYVLTEKIVLKQGTKTVATKINTFNITASAEPCTHSYIVTANTSTCTRNGSITQRCTLCGDTKTSRAIARGHKAVDGYQYDDESHYSYCEKCWKQINITAHTNPCSICGYNYECEPVNEMTYECDNTYHWIPCITDHNCPNNGKLYNTEHIAYTRQSGDWTMAHAPVHTAVEAGEIVYHCQLGYYCNDCNLYFGEKNIHEWVLFKDTETETIYKCVGATQQNDVSGHPIPLCTATITVNKAQHEHEWDIDNPIKNTATCTANGTLTVRCKGCDATKTATALATGHNYNLADCETEKKCSICGDTDGSVLNHHYDNACDDSCNRCGKKRTVGDHVYSNKCDADCNECGNIRTAPAHKYTWVCDTECNECGAVRVAADHTGGTATCTEKAKCTECGEEYGKLAEHDYEAATCTTPTICKVCGFIAGAQLGHAGGIATCTEQAVCAECGVKYGELAAHTVSVVKGKAATCTANGTIDHYKCDACGALCSDSDGLNVITDITVKATGHSIKKVAAVSATCTKNGNIEHYKCSKCSKLFSDSEGKKAVSDVSIKAKGHRYTNSCDTTCNTCKATRKITHTYNTVITKATLTKNGKVENKCSVCGNVSKTTTVYYPKTIKLSKTSYTYNGKAQTPSVSIKDYKGNTLKKDTDYTVKYASGRKSTGKYSVTITFKGKYSGTKTLYFNILPSKTSKIIPTCSTTEIKAIWSKVTGASGYKVELLNSKGKVLKSTITSKTSYTFKKLSKVTTYKIRVTAYKTIDKKAAYSTVSTTTTTSTDPPR